MGNAELGRRFRFDPARIVRPAKSLIFCTMTVALLSGCSSWPDSINPVEWSKDVADVFYSDEGEDVAKSDEPIPGEDGQYPQLSSVPDRPVVSAADARRSVTEGLVADRDNAAYTRPLTRQTASATDYRTGETTAVAVAAPSPVPAPAPQPTPQVARAAPAPAPVDADTPVVRRVPPPLVEESMLNGLPGGRPNGATPPPTAGQGLGIAPAPQVARAESPAPAPSPVVAAAVPAAAPVTTPTPVSTAQAEIASGAVVIDEAQLLGLGSGDVLAFSGANVPVGPTASMEVPEERAAARVGAQPLARYQPVGISQSHLVAQIQFRNGSSGLSSSDRAILRKVAELAAERGGVLRVVGHASSRTKNLALDAHVAANFKVSEDRAVSVGKALKSFGVAADRLFVGAAGAADPRYYGGTPAGEAGNRRTEIFIDY